MIVGNKRHSPAWWRNPDLAAALILSLAGLLFFGDALFSSKNFYYRDILNFHYPLRKILIDSFARWEFPLWNPFIYLGQPMLANPNYMTFYPTNLLHLLFSFNYAFKLHFILHPIAGGLGFYFLVSRLGIRRIPALVGALSYQFSGVVLSFLNLYNIIPAVALMPWAGWAFYGALQKHSLRRTAILGILLALQVIAFEPLIIQCNILLLAVLAVSWVREQKNRFSAIRLIAGISTVSALLAAGLTAIQTLPTIELLPLSARGAGLGLQQASEWSVHPLDFLNTIIPNFFGYPFTIDVSTYWGEAYHEFTAGYLTSFFLGSITILLSSLSLLSRRKKLWTSMLAFLGISLILGLGKNTSIYPWLYSHVPLLNLGRYPSKYFLLASLIVSILAALGLEAVMEAREDREFSLAINRRCIAGAVLGACAIGLAFYWTNNRSQLETMVRAAVMPSLLETKNFPAIASSLSNSIGASGAFLLLGSLVIIAGRRMKRFAVLGGLLALLVPLELVPANLSLAPLISDADMDFIPDIDHYIIQQYPQELGRAVTPNIMTPKPTGFTLRAPNRSMAWMVLFYRRSGQSLAGIRNGIQYSIDAAIDRLNTRQSEQLMRNCLKMPPTKRLALLANLNSPMVMSLEYLQDPRLEHLSRFDTHSNLDYHLYRLSDSLPRAYFATHVIPVVSEDEARNRLIAADTLHGRVILESASSPSQSIPELGGHVKITQYENNHVLCRVKANSDGYVVLLDSYYPGWRAKVDGKEASILRANFAFRAVRVPAGDHTVEFTFAPRTFYVGLLITVSTCLIAALLSFLVWAHSRSSSQQCSVENRRGEI